MKTTMILLLMIFLVSCQSSPERKLICKEIQKQQILPVEYCDIKIEQDPITEEIFSARCRCRMFDMNSWTEVSKPVNLPLYYCNEVAGPKLETIAVEVRPKVKALYRLKENLCQ